MTDKRFFMERALECARRAYDAGDVPVGAVIVKDGEIIAEGFNERESTGRASAHAELLAIERASEVLGRWRLSDCELYVTLEPCPMCAGAILNARLGKLCYALKDANSGSFGSVLNLNSYPLLHKIDAESGLCEEESRALLSDFFAKRRAHVDK